MIRGGRFGVKLCEAFLPNNSWGPSSIKERRDWQVVKMMTMMTMEWLYVCHVSVFFLTLYIFWWSRTYSLTGTCPLS